MINNWITSIMNGKKRGVKSQVKAWKVELKLKIEWIVSTAFCYLKIWRQQNYFYLSNGFTSRKATEKRCINSMLYFPKATNLIPVFFNVSFNSILSFPFISLGHFPSQLSYIKWALIQYHFCLSKLFEIVTLIL